MLILKRRLGQSVFVGEDIEVIFLGQKMEEIKLGFIAPDDVPIIRKELLINHLGIEAYKSLIDKLRNCGDHIS